MHNILIIGIVYDKRENREQTQCSLSCARQWNERRERERESVKERVDEEVRLARTTHSPPIYVRLCLWREKYNCLCVNSFLREWLCEQFDLKKKKLNSCHRKWWKMRNTENYQEKSNSFMRSWRSIFILIPINVENSLCILLAVVFVWYLLFLHSYIWLTRRMYGIDWHRRCECNVFFLLLSSWLEN